MLKRLIRGSADRKTRLHDQKGQLVPVRRALTNGPRSLVTTLLRVAAGIRPELPWISYDAMKMISDFLDKDKTVLEFGSGMSTVWYAKRAGRVYSVENHAAWCETVRDILRKRHLDNVDYRFAANDEEFAAVPEGVDGFDFIMVDGSVRDRCTKNAIGRLKPGGIFYLDNSDRMALPEKPEARAGQIALEYARAHGCEVIFFTDFLPTQFLVQEGMMVIRPRE